MPFVKPMLARPLDDKLILRAGEFAAEEKFDGHRIVCEISGGHTNLFTDKKITAWSRYGLERVLPTHLLEALCSLPDGLYDGELLVPGKRSYGVTELTNTSDLVYYIFDLLQYKNEEIVHIPYDDRRLLIGEVIPYGESLPIQLAASTNVNTWPEIYALRDSVWARDGEGLILKRRAAPYQIGKRSKDFIKIKDLRSAVLTVVGFIPSKGLINDRGPYATILLRDDDGNETTVKTRNDAECRLLEKEAVGHEIHPAIGRRLRIEYQERTPDKNYRHPRFDRWENQ